MTLVTAGDGNTPLSPDEEADLIPNLATRAELNEWERQNILEAWAWALDARTIRRLDTLSESYKRTASADVRPDVEVGGEIQDDRKEYRRPSPSNTRFAGNAFR